MIDDFNTTRMLLATTGLPQAEGFNFAKLFAYLMFGLIGTAAFIYGKKNVSWRAMALGVALMVYPYFVSATLPLYLIGIALTAALFFWRD